MSAPRPKRLPWVPILVVALTILLGGWALKAFGASRPVNILLMGLDEGKIRTDVVVLAHIDPKQSLVNLLSIPRDTLVEIDCSGLNDACVSPDKLAHAHAYGDDRGPLVTTRTVENLLGVTIDHYVRVDYEGFRQVVDTLGGVDLLIEEPMDYEDPYAHPPLSIHFQASSEPQHLDGFQALNYVRFRSDGLGDIGRTQRTKRFLVALGKKAKETQSLIKLPTVVNTLLNHSETNIDASTALGLAKAALKVDMDKIQMATLPGGDDPGHRRGWVWVPDEGQVAEVVDRLIKHPKPVEAEPAGQ